jgi:molybdopterin synthase sulfur carrier subunit
MSILDDNLVKVEFLGSIKTSPIYVEINNLNQLSSVLKENTILDEWLKISIVCVNDLLVEDINIELKSGDIISILPPSCGG